MKKIYQSFLLRIWISYDAGHTSWQASLEDPHTREIVTFHNENALIGFIQKISAFSNTELESDSM